MNWVRNLGISIKESEAPQKGAGRSVKSHSSPAMNHRGSLRSSFGYWMTLSVLLVASAAVGFGLAAYDSLAFVILALTTLIGMQIFGWRRLTLMLIAATFITRWRIPIAGMNLLVEHAVLSATFLALVLAGKGSQMLAAMKEPAVILIGLFIVWSSIVSLLRSPNPTASLEIVGWLALDWIMLAVLVASISKPSELVSAGAWCASLAASAGIVMWVASQMYESTVGVQFENQTGGMAVYGLSHEANLLASTLGIWTFLVLSVSSISQKQRWITVALSLIAIALTLTRSVFIGLLGGLLIWALFGLGGDRRRVLSALVVASLLIGSFILLAPAESSPLVAKSRDVLDFEAGNGALRVREWGTALSDLEGVDWFVGLGTNSFGQRHQDPTMPFEPRPAYLGNFPLQILYDTGFVGVFLLGSAVIALIPTKRKRMARACGAIVLFLASAIATSPFWFGSTWLIIALAVMDRRSSRRVVGCDSRPGSVDSINAPTSFSFSHD